MPTDSELSVLETIHDILKPLLFLTDALAGEKEVTASVVLPVLKHIKKKLAVDNDKDSMLAKGVKETIWSDKVGTWKLKYLKFWILLHFCIPDLEYLHKLYRKLQTSIYGVTQLLMMYIDINDASTSDVEEVHPAKRMKGLAAVLQRIPIEDDNVNSVTPLTPLQKIKKEVTSYFDYPHLSLIQIPLNGGKLKMVYFPIWHIG